MRILVAAAALTVLGAATACSTEAEMRAVDRTDAGAAADGGRRDEVGGENLVGLAVLALDHAVAAVLVEPAHLAAEHGQRSR